MSPFSPDPAVRPGEPPETRRPDETAAPHDPRQDAPTSDAITAGVVAARKFVGRLAQLDPGALHAVLATWRELMRTEHAAWFAAEAAVSRAIVASGRRDAQEPLLASVADAFRKRVWYGARAGRAADRPPETWTHVTEASGQYVATLAMLAVLVRDHLDRGTFDQLYRPFASVIPVAELARE